MADGAKARAGHIDAVAAGIQQPSEVPVSRAASLSLLQHQLTSCQRGDGETRRQDTGSRVGSERDKVLALARRW